MTKILLSSSLSLHQSFLFDFFCHLAGLRKVGHTLDEGGWLLDYTVTKDKAEDRHYRRVISNTHYGTVFARTDEASI